MLFTFQKEFFKTITFLDLKLNILFSSMIIIMFSPTKEIIDDWW